MPMVRVHHRLPKVLTAPSSNWRRRKATNLEIGVRPARGPPVCPAIVQLERARPSEGRDSGSTPDGWTIRACRGDGVPGSLSRNRSPVQVRSGPPSFVRCNSTGTEAALSRRSGGIVTRAPYHHAELDRGTEGGLSSRYRRVRLPSA